MVNQWDNPATNFALSATAVANLKAQGRTVLLSLGGGAGNVVYDSFPPTWSATLAQGLLAVAKTYGLVRALVVCVSVCEYCACVWGGTCLRVCVPPHA